MSETGHNKNVANFANYISIVTSFGASYKPSNKVIEIPSLTAKLNAFQKSLEIVTPKENTEALAINDRQAVFDNLSALVTRVGAAATATVNDALFSDNMRSVTRKLHGKRASPAAKTDPNAPQPAADAKKTISRSQMSFDNRIAHFAEMIDLLNSSGAYSPNEAELQTATLQTKLDDLRAKNTAAVNAINEARAARIARDETLYNDTNGILILVTLVKNYVKSVYGAQSPQYKQLTALKFKKG